MARNDHRPLGQGLLVGVTVLVLLVVAACGEIPSVPLAGQTTIDLEHFASLKAQVEELREQGRDVYYLDVIIADIEHWIAAGKVAEANLRIADLEKALVDFETRSWPTPRPELPLPPAPAYSPVSQTGATVFFEEDFAGTESLSAWQAAFLSLDPSNMATWQRRQDALYLNEGAGGMQIVGMIDVAGQEWADYVYSLDIFPQGNLEVGAIFRYLDGSFYRFRFLSWEYSGRPTRLLERVSDGEVVVLDQADGPGYQPEQWYNVQIVAEGAQLTVYLDGQQILQAKDDQLSRGKVGVFALSLGYVYFDNIRVTSVR